VGKWPQCADAAGGRRGQALSNEAGGRRRLREQPLHRHADSAKPLLVGPRCPRASSAPPEDRCGARDEHSQG
jgi:hypothetical protein